MKPKTQTKQYKSGTKLLKKKTHHKKIKCVKRKHILNKSDSISSDSRCDTVYPKTEELYMSFRELQAIREDKRIKNANEGGYEGDSDSYIIPVTMSQHFKKHKLKK
ncbi:MAG: hypothetical protein HQ490_01485 [Lutibacter sp.]|nr:hypothetical protein [Lutibacter sp.]